MAVFSMSQFLKPGYITIDKGVIYDTIYYRVFDE